ncbi:hypothetical protein D9619_010021 [Psilocybe cf. subviscida]|uniref:F-box domain-containing protein n=1 Tax=Psilocybe cf. subviscida TaxID=2480587 RepID=A0A8H5F6V4_9AGAR|nr:hypothetical protein D9619_010021 [Psilocybe cf. subviscida]
MATHNSYHEAQLLVDEEIACLTAGMQPAIMLPKTRRNFELASVSKLPDEILLRIFLILRDSSGRHLRDWHQVTHTCRYWRGVAIGSPLLWTHLFEDTSPAFIQLMLERSRSAPLEVELLKSEHSTRALTIILQEIERIRTLNLYFMPCDLLDTVYDIVASFGRDWEASLLGSLMVGISSGPRPASVKTITDVFRPTRLLRRLTLSGGYYHWDMFPLPNLTCLCLEGESLGEVSGAQFMETLRQMQNLEVLKMHWDGMHISQFPPIPRPQPVHLPCLQKLEIRDGHQVHLESFLSLLRHPKLHQLEVNPFPVIDVAAFTKTVYSLIGKGNFGPLEFLRIQQQYTNITALPDTIIDDRDDDQPLSFINIYINALYIGDLDVNDGTRFEFVVDILSCIPLLDFPYKLSLRHISLDSTVAPIGGFSRLFTSIPHLETIELRDETALALFKALEIAPVADRAIPSTPIPFPKLQSITWNGGCYYGEEPVPILSAAVFNVLYSGLLSRHRHGVPITKLQLVQCERLDNAQAHLLNEIGVKIIVRQDY